MPLLMAVIGIHGIAEDCDWPSMNLGLVQKSLTRGHISLEVTYMPFSEGTRDAGVLAKAQAKQTMGSTSLNANTKGVLVVHVVRGINLEVGLPRIMIHNI